MSTEGWAYLSFRKSLCVEGAFYLSLEVRLACHRKRINLLMIGKWEDVEYKTLNNFSFRNIYILKIF